MGHVYKDVLNKLSSDSSFIKILPSGVVSDIVRVLFPYLSARDYQILSV